MNDKNCIDYSLFADAVTAYRKQGFRRIEVPWFVTADIANTTKPAEVPESSNYRLSVNGKCLLASGEQAFLYLANKGQLPPGMYQAVTPCFRNEPYDSSHSKQFMKLELINLLAPDAQPHQSMISALADGALEVFNQLLVQARSNMKLRTVFAKDPRSAPKTEQLDIVAVVPQLDGSELEIELGSYGARTADYATWIYGTGIAEPRFSKTLALYESKCLQLKGLKL